jgi:hypothetical protein
MSNSIILRKSEMIYLPPKNFKKSNSPFLNKTLPRRKLSRPRRLDLTAVQQRSAHDALLDPFQCFDIRLLHFKPHIIEPIPEASIDIPRPRVPYAVGHRTMPSREKKGQIAPLEMRNTIQPFVGKHNRDTRLNDVLLWLTSLFTRGSHFRRN